jgi:predicted nucleotidyltransferase
VGEVAQGFPALVAAYLFGSALGACRPDSDIDLGVILRIAAGPRSVDELELGLGSIAGHPFHVTALTADSAFAFHVVRGGLLVFSADDDARLQFLQCVALQNFYDGPHLNTAAQALREEAGF